MHYRLRRAFDDCRNLAYGSGGMVRFPRYAPGLPRHLIGWATAIDCSSLTAYMLLHAFQGQLDDPSRLYKDLQVWSLAEPWSPITGALRERLGVEVPKPRIGRWCLLQSWRMTDGKPKSGHAMLVRREADGLWAWHSSPYTAGPKLDLYRNYQALMSGRTGRLVTLEKGD